VQEVGARTFTEVERATLEPNGRLVVQVKRPSPVDMGRAELAADYAALRQRLDELTELVRRALPRSDP
jgi:uncharacterized membrane protein YcaP (DUF421 family)